MMFGCEEDSVTSVGILGNREKEGFGAGLLLIVGVGADWARPLVKEARAALWTAASVSATS